MKTHAGSQIKARKPGDAKYKPLEAAPGYYVKVRFNPEKQPRLEQAKRYTDRHALLGP